MTVKDSFDKWLNEGEGRLIRVARPIARRLGWRPAEKEQAEEPELVCCGGGVIIAYRGLADDRLYIAYNRKWTDVRFFRPHGLRVYCSVCRTRVY